MKPKFYNRKDYSELEKTVMKALYSSNKKTSKEKFENICKEFKKFEDKIDRKNKGIDSAEKQ